jgi:hypothetical protein
MDYKLKHREPGWNDTQPISYETYENAKTLSTVDKLWNPKGKLKFILHSTKNIAEGERLDLMYKNVTSIYLV